MLIRTRLSVLWVAALAVLTGCAIARVPEAKLKGQTAALSAGLRRLSPEVDAAEASLAASAALRYPLRLAVEYHARPPAIFNNLLVNFGVHPRGLCYQWADDLTAKLMSLDLRTLELHRGVARLGTRREHSCVVLTSPGQSFAKGIALDAWRHCGRLTWSPVAFDKYPWEEVNLAPSYQDKLQAAATRLAVQSGESWTSGEGN